MVTVIQNLLRGTLKPIWTVDAIQSIFTERILRKKRQTKTKEQQIDAKYHYYTDMLWTIIWFSLGSALYFSIPMEPAFNVWFPIFGLVSIAGVIFNKTFHSTHFRLIFLMTLCGIVGFSYASFRTHLVENKPLQKPLERVIVEGWVTDYALRAPRERLTIKVHAISGISGDQKIGRVRVSQTSSENVGVGRFIRCFVNLNPPPEPSISGDYQFAREAYFQNLSAVGFVLGRCKPAGIGSPSKSFDRLHNYLFAFRNRLANHVAEKAGPAGGVAATLLTGSRSYLTVEQEDILRNSGLAHLLAISGLHMGLAAGAFYLLFFRGFALIEPLAIRFPVQKLAALGALTAITGYLLLTGASVSAQRAYIMVSVGLIAILFDAPVLSIQTLALSMFLVLLLSPHAVLTPGFQMSFAAAGALIRVFTDENRSSDRTLKRSRVISYLRPIFMTSVVAGLATMPFAIYHFGRAASLGFFSNFLIMPLFSLVCVPLAVMSAITLPMGISDLPLHLFGYSLELVLKLASYFQGAPNRSALGLEKPFPMFTILAVSGALICWCVQGRRTLLISVALLLLSFGGWQLSKPNEVVVSNSGHIAYKDRVNDTWKAVKLKNAALAPLRFSHLEIENCPERCQLRTGNYQIEVDGYDINAEHIITGERQVFSRYRSFELNNTKHGLSVTDREIHNCRLWNSPKDDCKG